MRENSFLYSVFLVYLFIGFCLNGCVSASSSPAPRFYMLESMDESQVSKKFDIPTDTIIGFGPVDLPEYLNRPQIVTQNKEKMLKFAQFDRWGEPLDLALIRLMSADLIAMLPGVTVETYPWNLAVPVNYQVLLEVIQMESELDSGLLFVAQWAIIDPAKKKMLFIKRSFFRQPIQPHTYAGLTKTLSGVCASLTGEIAEAVASLEAADKKRMP